MIPLCWSVSTAIRLSIISRLAVSLNFSNGVTVPVVFHLEGSSMKAVTVFVVSGVWSGLRP